MSLSHRDQSLLPTDGQDRVIREGPTRCRIDKHMQILIDLMDRRGLREENIQEFRLENLGGRVEGKTRKLTHDEVGTIFHDHSEHRVAALRLPARH